MVKVVFFSRKKMCDPFVNVNNLDDLEELKAKFIEDPETIAIRARAMQAELRESKGNQLETQGELEKLFLSREVNKASATLKNLMLEQKAVACELHDRKISKGAIEENAQKFRKLKLKLDTLNANGKDVMNNLSRLDIHFQKWKLEAIETSYQMLMDFRAIYMTQQQCAHDVRTDLVFKAIDHCTAFQIGKRCKVLAN